MDLKIQENVPLHSYTTLQTGGVARYFIAVKSQVEVVQAALFDKQKALPVLILGRGSNLLIDDTPFPGVVIYNQLLGREYKESEDGVVTLMCGAGEILDEVIAEAVLLGYSGLENLSAVPGTVGATPIQNVGAYGVEVAQIILQVETIDLTTGTTKVFSNLECNFGYRDSFFKTNLGKNYFITAVCFKLKKEFTPQISYQDLKNYFINYLPTLEAVRAAVIAIRSQKFPDWKVVGTAGSFFKNPLITNKEAEALKAQYPDLPVYEAGLGMSKISLGYLLDKVCHLKGYQVGQVGLYPKQALVLVNYGGASATEIKNFAAHIAELVYKKTKIIISLEVSLVDNK